MTSITVKDSLMKVVDNYLDEKPRKLSKAFYTGVTENPAVEPGAEKTWGFTKDSLKTLVDILAQETVVDMFVSFANVYKQIVDAETAAKPANDNENENDTPSSMRVQKVVEPVNEKSLENVD